MLTTVDDADEEPPPIVPPQDFTDEGKVPITPYSWTGGPTLFTNWVKLIFMYNL